MELTLTCKIESHEQEELSLEIMNKSIIIDISGCERLELSHDDFDNIYDKVNQYRKASSEMTNIKMIKKD